MFTGAGFSRSISDRFFTTREFYDQHIESFRYPWAREYIKDLIAADFESEDGPTPLDVELFARKLSKALSAFSVVAPRDETQVSIGSHVSNLGSKVITRDLSSFLRDITTQTLEGLSFDYLVDPEDRKRVELAKSFMKDLAVLGNLAVFSTNYDDLVPREIYGPGEKDYYLDEYRRIDIDVLMSAGKPFSYMPLKGMLNWRFSEDDPGRLIQDNSLTNDTNKPVIMPFQEDLAPDRPPHDKLYERLETTLADVNASQLLLFVGFSFRDSHINALIRRHLKRKHHVIVVVKGEDADFFPRIKKDIFSVVPKNQFTLHNEGFGEVTMKNILKRAKGLGRVRATSSKS